MLGSTLELGAAGDLNGDGYGDFAVGERNLGPVAPSQGRVSVFFGGPVLNGTPDLTLPGGAPYDAFGWHLAGERDLNGDGFMDLVVGAPNANVTGLTEAGEVRIFHGGPNVDAVADRILQGTSTDAHFGLAVDLLADFNGDGFSDLVVGQGSTGVSHRIWLFHGGPAFDAFPDWTINAGPTVRAGDDVNHDGFSDVLAFVDSGSNVFFGGSSADTSPDSPLVGEPPTPRLPYSSAFPAGDVDGNGYQDWLVLSSAGSEHASAILSLYTASPEVTVGVDPPSGTLRMAISPSPARRTDILTMTIPALSGPAGPVNDVAVQVLDLSGREVGRLTPGRGPGAGSFQWVPAQHGVRSGIYFLRVQSRAAGFDGALKFVVVD
jgi:hypothetical protein